LAENVIWGIHVAAEEGDRLHRDKSTIAIGWDNVGNLRDLQPDRESFKAAVQKVFPAKPKGYVINAASQLFRFANEMKQGDWIVYRSTYFDGLVYVGKIASDYIYAPGISASFPQQRKVTWLGSFSPTKVSQGALYELGSALTLFRLHNYGEEYIQALEGKNTPPDVSDDETVAFVADDIEQQTAVFVLKELSRHLKGHTLQAFVADLLRTMGYRTVESKQGPDEGVDIIAHRDELKLEPPIIKIQVKSGDGTVGRPEVQALFGTLGHGEFGLFITLANYAKQAIDFGKTKTGLRLIDGEGLVKLILDHYDDLQPRYKALIPLKRVFIPQAKADFGE
jgi:restriction system protein